MKPRDGVVFYAKEYLGTPYRLGGNSSSGIDCSGLIHNA
ncbi:MAG: NlpC/P60 family protein, partial [Flavobacteriaceae bacterium]|nr:NlpC/P60 family protein [Flavobacteriaceae bacterium]